MSHTYTISKLIIIAAIAYMASQFVTLDQLTHALKAVL